MAKPIKEKSLLIFIVVFNPINYAEYCETNKLIFYNVIDMLLFLQIRYS